jgi:dCTP deaminase
MNQKVAVLQGRGHSKVRNLLPNEAPAELEGKSGILPDTLIRTLIRRDKIRALTEFQDSQIQPASIDLRLGRHAYRVRASFLPGRGQTVEQQLRQLQLHEFSLKDGAILERGCVYVVEIDEFLALPDIIAAIGNPKSSTGRIDVFTRLITDHCEVFDHVAAGYKGRLFAEISPRTFSIRVRSGSKLGQLRFLRRSTSQDPYERPTALSDKALKALHAKERLVDGEPTIRNGLNVRVELGCGHKTGRTIVGYRALRHTGIVDVDNVGGYRTSDFWEPIKSTDQFRLILDPGEFYILASKERVYIPPGFAAEMAPIDPMMGEFRAHYAGFFDPGFGQSVRGKHGSKAVLEVRSYDVPFVLEDGQIIARLDYERLAEAPMRGYGRGIKSNYQGQGLKLSKHFRAD